MVTRRTSRRYAHEIYPHAKEGEVRSLSVEVPYLYARAIGMEVRGTSWSSAGVVAGGDRISTLMEARNVALLADAIAQGLTGDEAWAWAAERVDESGEWTFERAAHYGVDYKRIKPYPCGPEPDRHDHHGPPDRHGWREVTQIDGRESECLECTEEVSA